MAPRLLLTPAEAARALGIGRSKLFELLATGAIPSIRIGSCRRIALDDLRAFVEKFKQQQAVPQQRRPGRPRAWPDQVAD